MNYVAITNIYKATYDDPDDETLSTRMDVLTKFEESFTNAIEQQHCESFIAFEDEIADFVVSFMKSVVHSKWRSLRNKFIFAYTQNRYNITPVLDHTFFKDQPNVLFIEIINETLINLKTTKFIGSRKDHPEELILLDKYEYMESIEFLQDLYPDKLRDLKGRELIVAAFPYEPFSILKNSTKTNVMDVGNGNEDPSKKILYDGTDAQFFFHLCWLYNCTVQVDSSVSVEWGFVYRNFTAHGILGLIFDRKADVSMMALYMWDELYHRLDMSSQTSRSGATCLVPKPKRLTSWLLPFQPFQFMLWLSIAGCLGIETIGLVVTRKIGKQEANEQSWFNCLKFGYISTLKLFISQGTHYLVTSISVRIVLLSCYMIDIVLTSVYSGGLASILTIPSFEEAADSVDRLAKYKLIWAGTSYDWILLSSISDDKKINQIVANYRVYSYEDLRAKSLTEHIGFVIERMQYGHFAVPAYIHQEAVDRLKVMIDDIYFQYCVAYSARSWPLLEKYNNFVMMVQSSGLNKFWEWMVVAKYLNQKIQKQLDESVSTNFGDGGAVELMLDNFAGIIVIWIGGSVLSILVFLGEVFHCRWK